ncbi:MAG: hypothetical protein V5B40_02740 [Candidatus Accumulibacter meliphilus]
MARVILTRESQQAGQVAALLTVREPAGVSLASPRCLSRQL